jgi:pimeloyl-ACP methyl ester carboxylesterase
VEVDGPAAPPVPAVLRHSDRVWVVKRIALVLVGLLVGLLAVLTLASVAYNLATSDPNVPVTKLWHGPFAGGTAYRQWGSHGPAVILLGGFLEPSFVWGGVGTLLGRDHRVYALDLDGFGYTVRHGPYTLAHWADQVQAFDRRLGLRRPVVVGHSLGAAVAVELARRGAASKAVLLDGDAVAEGGPPSLVRDVLVHTPFFTTLYRLATNADWVVRRVLKNAYGPLHPPLGAALVDRWTDQFRAKGARQALQGIAKAGIAGFSRSALASTHVRALVLWGARDGVDSASAGRETARDLHARFVLLPGAGHLSMTESPAAIVRSLRAFAPAR